MNIADPRGRPKGSPKSGGKKRGAVTVQSEAVKEAVLRVFNNMNDRDRYLEDIAENDPRLFLSLVARLIPVAQEVKVQQTINYDLGAAMAAANAQLAAGGAPVLQHSPEPLPEHTPEPLPEQLEHDPGDPQPSTKPWPGY
jgi:hypothetical protein